MSDARRITGRHLLLDGPGAVIEVPHGRLERALERLAVGMATLRWSGTPRVRLHRAGATLGVHASPDQLRAAVGLLEWAEGDGDDDDLADVQDDVQRDGNPALCALYQAFPGMVFEGEGLVTVGLGEHARSFDEDALPAPGDVRGAGRIPFAYITGTNGKTTTTRLLAHLAMTAGFVSGRTSSDGVVIGKDVVELGDWTGPGAARRVLRDPRVNFAALETARGGILRRGLILDGADAAVITNVTAEHLGEWGIDDVFDMARAKLVVGAALRRGGTLVLPRHSDPLARVLPELRKRRPDIQVRTFSSVAPGADAWADDQHLRIGHVAIPLAEIPITFGGTARHNVENALAATLLALALRLPGEAINRGLRTFRPTVTDNPGRMNTFRLPSGGLVVLDFAHNADGLVRVAQTVRRWPRSRRVLLLGQAGDRPDDDLVALAKAALTFDPHRVVLKDVTARLYDRAEGEVPAVLRRALTRAGYPEARIDGPYEDELTGVRAALRGCGPDTVVLLLLHETLQAAMTLLTDAGAEPVEG